MLVLTANQRFVVASARAPIIDSISDLVSQLGHVCDWADTVADALDLVEVFDPHVVIVDLALPGIAVHGIARAMRMRSRSDQLFVVAVSPAAHATAAAGAGFDACVALPIDRVTIAEVALQASIRRIRAS